MKQRNYKQKEEKAFFEGFKHFTAPEFDIRSSIPAL